MKYVTYSIRDTVYLIYKYIYKYKKQHFNNMCIILYVLICYSASATNVTGNITLVTCVVRTGISRNIRPNQSNATIDKAGDGRSLMK